MKLYKSLVLDKKTWNHRTVRKLFVFDRNTLYYKYIILPTGVWAKWVDCSPMVREHVVQFQVESYQRLKKWYLMPSCLKLRYGSRVKWSDPEKGAVPSLKPQCSSYWKRSLWSPSTKVTNFTLPNYQVQWPIGTDGKTESMESVWFICFDNDVCMKVDRWSQIYIIDKAEFKNCRVSKV